MTTTQKTQPNSTVLSQGNAESYERGQGGATDTNPDTLLPGHTLLDTEG